MDLVPREYKRPGNSASQAAPNGPGNFGLGNPTKISLSSLPKSFDYLKFSIIAAAVLLILAFVIWGGLKIYEGTFNSKINSLKKQEAAVFEPQDQVLAQNIADLQKRAQVAEDFFKAHVYTSELLDSIASQTLPKVKWDNYDLSVKDDTVILKGEAADYSVLAKQLFTFGEDQSGFSKVTVSGIALDKSGVVNFSVSFAFDPKILQK